MKKLILLTGLAGALFAATAMFAADDAATNTSAAATNDATPPDQAAPPDDQTPQPPPAADQAPPPDQAPPADAAAPATTAPVAPVPTPAPMVAPVVTSTPVPSNVPPGTTGEQGLRMNFKNAPLDQVLGYLSDAAGFIISERGSIDNSVKVTIMSAQPVSKDDAIKLLKQKLNENGYTALEDGRMLTIIRSGESRSSEVPVAYGDKPDLIPKNTDVRTQIVPVHTLNVIQLIKELDSLRPADTTLQADESANSIIITGPQASIRHLMEVVEALDGVNSGSATVRVYHLQYADATKLVTMIKDLFPSQDTTGGGVGNRFGRFGRGGGGGGGFPFGGGFPGLGGGGGDSGGESNGHTPTAKVEATADDNSNSLIVSAPDTLIETIDELVKSLDVTVEDTTLVKIFYLKNADPNEMANLLTSLYPDDTSGSTPTAGIFRPFGGFGFGGGGGRGGNNNAAAQSERTKKMSHVGAVSDPRTRSLVVTAGKDLMPDIEAMVLDLDKRDDGKLKVHVIPLANAEPIDVMGVLQSMFPSSLSTGSSSSQLNSSTSNPLLNRQNTLLQQQNNTTTSTFGSSTGSSSGRGL